MDIGGFDPKILGLVDTADANDKRTQTEQRNS